MDPNKKTLNKASLQEVIIQMQESSKDLVEGKRMMKQIPTWADAAPPLEKRRA